MLDYFLLLKNNLFSKIVHKFVFMIKKYLLNIYNYKNLRKLNKKI
jgi:hypothetical protein